MVSVRHFRFIVEIMDNRTSREVLIESLASNVTIHPSIHLHNNNSICLELTLETWEIYKLHETILVSKCLLII